MGQGLGQQGLGDSDLPTELSTSTLELRSHRLSEQVTGNALGYTTTTAQIRRRKWKQFCTHYLPAQLLAPGASRA